MTDKNEANKPKIAAELEASAVKRIVMHECAGLTGKEMERIFETALEELQELPYIQVRTDRIVMPQHGRVIQCEINSGNTVRLHYGDDWSLLLVEAGGAWREITAA